MNVGLAALLPMKNPALKRSPVGRYAEPAERNSRLPITAVMVAIIENRTSYAHYADVISTWKYPGANEL